MTLLPSLIHFLAAVLHPTLGTKHLEVHMKWLEALLDIHAGTLMQWIGSNNVSLERNVVDPLLMQKVSVGDVQALLLQCLQQVNSQYSNLKKVFDKNLYSIAYLATQQQQQITAFTEDERKGSLIKQKKAEEAEKKKFKKTDEFGVIIPDYVPNAHLESEDSLMMKKTKKKRS